jgi:hypothetical protein
MKKLIIVLCLATISLTGYAQQDLRFGFQMSPSFSWMSTSVNHINSSGTNLGLKLGIVGEFYFRENYALVSGIGFHFNAGGTLLHENEGFYWRNSDIPASVMSDTTFASGTKLKYGIQYLEIPIGLKMRTREFGYVRYYFQPDITLGFKSQARGSIEGVGITDGDEKYNIRKEVNGLNMSWGLGGGIEYTITENTSLVAGLAFQKGFTDVTDDRRDQYFDSRDANKLKAEKSKGVVNAITLKVGIIF